MITKDSDEIINIGTWKGYKLWKENGEYYAQLGDKNLSSPSLGDLKEKINSQSEDGGPGSGPAKGYKGKPSGWSRFAKLSPEEKKAEVRKAVHKR